MVRCIRIKFETKFPNLSQINLAAAEMRAAERDRCQWWCRGLGLA
jgi:hypothetical protein